MRSIIPTLVPITRLNSKIEIPAASASVANVWRRLYGPRLEMGEQFVKEHRTWETLATAWRIREDGGDARIFTELADEMRAFFERHDVGYGYPQMLWHRYAEWHGPDFRVSDETERRVSALCYGLLYRAARYFDELKALEKAA